MKKQRLGAVKLLFTEIITFSREKKQKNKNMINITLDIITLVYCN